MSAPLPSDTEEEESAPTSQESSSQPISRPQADITSTVPVANIITTVPDVSPRTSHLIFIWKVQLLSTTLMICALLQWFGLTRIDKVVCFLKVHKIWILPLVLIAFLVFLAFIGFFQSSSKRPKVQVLTFVVFTAEMGSVPLMQPMARATNVDILYSALMIGFVFLVSAFISLQFRETPLWSTKILILWTGRYFVVSGIGTSLAYALRSAEIQMSFGSFVSLFLIIFILAFGKAIGCCRDAYNANHLCGPLFTVLAYFNAVSLYANVLMCFGAMRRL